MKARELPGALGLGLLASLLAHSATYGNSHAAGGAYHELLSNLAAIAAGSMVCAAWALAVLTRGRCSVGSVLAARLRPLLPGLPLLASSAALWLGATESLEPGHGAVPAVVLAAILIVAAVAVRWLAGIVIEAIAAVAFAACTAPGFAPRVPSWARRLRSTPVSRRPGHTRRRFARPPPALLFVATP